MERELEKFAGPGGTERIDLSQGGDSMEIQMGLGEHGPKEKKRRYYTHSKRCAAPKGGKRVKKRVVTL